MMQHCIDIIDWAKHIYSPLRTDGLAHRMYLRRQAIAIPIDFELVDMTGHSDLHAQERQSLLKQIKRDVFT